MLNLVVDGRLESALLNLFFFLRLNIQLLSVELDFVLKIVEDDVSFFLEFVVTSYLIRRLNVLADYLGVEGAALQLFLDQVFFSLLNLLFSQVMSVEEQLVSLQVVQILLS